MAIDFPNSPTSGDLYTAGGKTWQWNGTYWASYGTVPVLRTSDTAPVSPNAGDLWYETDTGRFFTYIDSVWVEIGNATDIAGALQPGQVTALSAVTSLTSDDVFPVVDNPASATASNKITANDLASQLTQFAPQTSFRNKIINGSFEFWQRGTARTYLNAGSYLADRWTIRQYQNGSHQRTTVTPVTGMQTRYALKVGSSTTAENAGGTRMWANTELESGDSIPLRGKTVTLSFWVRFSSATATSSTATPYGNFSGGIDWCTSTIDAAMGTTGTDNGSSTTITNGSLPTTWTKYTVSGTISGIANNVGVQFGFANLGSTAVADTVWYEVTQVQLEVGSVATPFEQRPIQTELALCQRYYYRVKSTAVGDRYGVGYGVNALQTVRVIIPFQTEMRIKPHSFETTATATDYSIVTAATATVSNNVPTLVSATLVSADIAFGVASGVTDSFCYHGRASTTSSYLAFSAEL